MKRQIDTLASLHADTPEVAVAGSAGAAILALRFLRHPAAPAAPARILKSRTVKSILDRAARQYGARPLKDDVGQLLPDAVTVTALSGQNILLYTADGDAAYSLSDAAGRPLWHRSARGTMNTFTYEEASKGGRPLSVSETNGAGHLRMRERIVWMASDDVDARSRNLVGVAVAHYDNAGMTETLSVALTGQSLKTEQRLLTADAQEPDWSAVSQPATEVPLTLSWAYDATGTPLSQTNAAGVTTFTAYEVNGSVRGSHVRYTPKPGKPAEEAVMLRDILYRADGVVLSQNAGNGITEEYEYDSRTQHLIRHAVRRPAGHPAGALLLSDLHYCYDPAGNILTLEDKGTDPNWHNNQQSKGLQTYGYDTLYRLTSATGRERVMRAQRRGPQPFDHVDPTAGSAWSPYDEAYQYDDGDNLIMQTHTGVSGWTRATAVSSRSNRAVMQERGHFREVDPHDAYQTGGLRKALSDGRKLDWNADGQLYQVRPVERDGEENDSESYRYRFSGSRVRKVSIAKVAGGMQTLVTTHAGGVETRRRFMGDHVQLDICVTEAAHTRVISNELKCEVYLRYSFADHLGSVTLETDEAGYITSREEYYPYGESAGADEESDEVKDRMQRYSGKERDATGLLYYGWRYYQPEAGRWLNADPGGLIDGANLFRFCRNNPINIIDTDGRGCAGSKAAAVQNNAYDEMLARRAGLESLNSTAVGNNQASSSASSSGASVIPADRNWSSWEEVMQGNNESIKLVHTLKTDHTDSVLLNKSINQEMPDWKMISTSLIDLKTWNGDSITYGEIAFVLKGSPANLIKTAPEDIVFNNHQDSEFKRLTGLGLEERNASNKKSEKSMKFRQDLGIWPTKQLLETTARNRTERTVGFGSEKKYNEVIVTGREGYDIHKNGLLSSSIAASEIIVLPDPEESVNWDDSGVPQLKGKLKSHVNKVANVNPDLKINIRWPARPVVKVPEFRF